MDRSFDQFDATIDDLPTVVHSDREIMSGTPVFVGTRVPVRSLIDYLAGGHTLDFFVDQFPGVKREQAITALEIAGSVLVTTAYANARSVEAVSAGG